MEIPPYSTVAVSFKLTVYRTGPFSDRRALYLDDGQLRIVQLSVRGIGVEPAQEQAADQ